MGFKVVGEDTIMVHNVRDCKFWSGGRVGGRARLWEFSRAGTVQCTDVQVQM